MYLQVMIRKILNKLLDLAKEVKQRFDAEIQSKFKGVEFQVIYRRGEASLLNMAHSSSDY